jgi:hypothetical protein
MADRVTQTFTADDASLRRAQEEQIRNTIRQQNEQDKLASKSKQAALEDIKNLQAVRQALEDLIRRMQDLKRARGELIQSTNFYTTGRGGGAANVGPGGVDWRFADRYRLGYSGGPAGPAGYLGYRIPPGGPNFTMEPQDIPRLGYTQRSNISTVHAAQSLRMASILPSVLTSSVRQVAGLVAGFLTVETALRAINYQLELTVKNEQDAANAHRSMASGQAEIVLNTFGRSDADREKLFSAGKRISKLGFQNGQIERVLGRQAGRGGELSLDQIIEATEISARLTRHTPEQLEPTAQGVQQLLKYGVPNARQAAALFQAAASEAYPGNPELQARMLQQTVASGMANLPKGAQNAASAEQLLEFSAAASQLGGEERGEAVRTALVALLSQRQEFVEGRGAWERSGPYGLKFHPKIAGAPESPREFFEWLRANPRQGTQFWDKANFERQYEGILRRMLMEPDSEQGKLLAGVQDRVRPDLGALDTQLRGIENATPQLSTATQAMQSAAAKNQFDARRTIEALQSEARTIRDETMGGTYRFGQEFGWQNYFRRQANDLAGVSPEESALGMVRQRRREIEYGRSISGSALPLLDEQRDSPQRNQARELLDRQIKRLEEIRDEIRQLRSTSPSLSPAANAQRGVQSER